MSKKCTIAVKDGGDSTIKVKMTGDGKEWHKQVKPMPKGETVIIGGDDKNQSAWLVVLRHAEAKAVEIKPKSDLPKAIETKASGDNPSGSRKPEEKKAGEVKKN
jgi:hypothetical protein